MPQRTSATGLYLFGIRVPAPRMLIELWTGQVHMHTAFWIVWCVPILLYSASPLRLSLIFEIPLMLYLVVATVGAWRATNHPPGALWAALLYRGLLLLFIVSAGLVIAMTGYIALNLDAP